MVTENKQIMSKNLLFIKVKLQTSLNHVSKKCSKNKKNQTKKSHGGFSRNNIIHNALWFVWVLSALKYTEMPKVT